MLIIVTILRQVTGLRKIAAFCKDSNLREDRQAEIRDRCLKFWKVPDAVRKIPPIENPKVNCPLLIDFLSESKNY